MLDHLAELGDRMALPSEGRGWWLRTGLSGRMNRKEGRERDIWEVWMKHRGWGKE